MKQSDEMSGRTSAHDEEMLSSCAAGEGGQNATPRPTTARGRASKSSAQRAVLRVSKASAFTSEGISDGGSRRHPVTFTPSVYYVERGVNETDKRESDQRFKAERHSIAKLLIISQSVGSLFCSIPGSESVAEYIKQVDSAELGGNAGKLSHNGRDAASPSASSFIGERILSEENADHLFCMHVRDMEQLTPPPHLADPKKSVSKTKKSTKSRSKKTEESRKEEGAPALEPLERLKALHKWRLDALKQSQASFKRNAIPNDAYAITRLRLHEPVKADVTVVQSCDGPKKSDAMLAAINQFAKEQRRDPSWNLAEDEEDIMKAIFLAAFTQQLSEEHDTPAAFLERPSLFFMKPLLTVYASCLPRRDSHIGQPTHETHFLLANTKTVGKRRDASAASSEVLPSAGMGESLHAQLENRRIPPVPRHTTCVTLLVEHNEMEVSDLVSMAEIATTRKVDDKVTKCSPLHCEESSELPRMYCLIRDGGKV